MRREYRKILTVILVIIIVAIICLLAYLGFEYYTQQKIKKDNEAAVDAFKEEVLIDAPDIDGSINTNTNANSNINMVEENTANSNPIGEIIEESNSSTNTPSGTKNATKRRQYKGFYMLGTIEIPKTGIKYTVLEKVTKKSLETSVAVQYPYENPVLNAVGNVVIVGHNYRNGVFFSNNKKLSNGDKIYITDLEGKKVVYTVYSVFQTAQNDTEFYNRDTDGKMEITLSTCTDASNDQRIIVLAAAE